MNTDPSSESQKRRSGETETVADSPSHRFADSFIERVIEWSARNKFMVFMLVGALTLGGVYCLRNTPLDAIPDLTDVQVIVFSQWEGRSPSLVEDQITYPIVTKLISAPNVRTVRGYSFFGYSFVYVIFKDGTDIYWARSRVLEYMQGLAGNLPPGVTPTLGPDATGVGWGFQYALVDKSGKRDLADLRSFQQWHLRYWIQSVEGVAEVATIGGFEKQYQVEIDPDRLLAYNIPISKIVSAIRSANNDVGGRELEQNGTTYLVRGKGYITSLDDLRLVVVGADARGTPVLLKDVARNVAFGPEMRRGAGDLNGEGETPGGIVVVRFGQNVLQVIDRIKAKLAEVKPSLPEGVEIVTTYDRSDLINRSIKTLTRTIIEESIIVSIIVIVFLLDFGGAARAIVTLPIAVALAFIPMYFMGLTANIMSLAGIAIAIGALCDEAVVMVENVHKHLEHAPPGLSRKQKQEVIIKACKQLGKPLFFALLVITVSFMPVFTLESQEGRLFKPLAFTKTFTMAWAAFLSITIGPALIVLMTGAKVIPEHKHPISRLLHRIYYPWVSMLMTRRILSIVIAVVAVASSYPIYKKLGSEFMPPLDEGSLLYMPSTLPGISVNEAQKLMQTQDRIIKGFPEVDSVLGKAGRAETSTDPAPFSMMETVIILKPQDQWRKVDTWYSSWTWAPEWLKDVFRHITPDHISTEQLVEQMNEALKLPGVSNAWTMPIKARIDMLTTGIRTPVGIKIYGSDIRQIERLGTDIEGMLPSIRGTRNVFAERTGGGYFVDFEWKREELARYGLSIEDVQGVLMSAVGGENVTTTIEGRERYPVNVRYFRDFRSDIGRLRRVLVPAMDGKAQIPLSQLADIKLTSGPAMLRDENGMLNGYVYVDVAGRDVGSYVEEAKKLVREKVKLPAGYTIAWSGQYEAMERVKKRLTVILPLTVFIVLMLLYLNTKSLAKTALIMLAVPFSAVGAIWFLYLLGYNMSIGVWVGLIALMGVDAETGVFMLLYLDLAYEKAKAGGKLRSLVELQNAIHDGAVKRIRPKFMTVACMFMGLVPIMWSTGAGADVMRRIAAPMIGGIFTSFILELVVYPAIYEVWKWNSEVKKQLT